MRFYAHTMPGVEEIAWLEIRSRWPKAQFVEYQFAKEQNGIVIFDYDGSPDDLLQLQTAEDVYIHALSLPKVSRSRRDLANIEAEVSRGEAVGRAVNSLMRYRKYNKPPSYRVISRKYGNHDYRRIDFERAVFSGLMRRYPQWQPLPDGTQVEFWANLLGSHMLLGIRISSKKMRHRFNRRVELPAALRPSVAAAMVFLTNPDPSDVFLDPMCGSGTILMARRSGNGYQRILGGDIVPERMEAAKQNLLGKGKTRLPRSISVRLWDAKKLPLDSGSIDKVATNLPFGKQIGSKTAVKRLYPAVFKELERVVRPNGRLAILSSEYDLVKQAVRQCPNLEIERGYSIAVLGQWGRLYLMKRT
ncbi:MAG: methyltransferase domain-containing protein [Chloroflexota bacterium]